MSAGYLTPLQVAERLGLSDHCVRNRFQDGTIQAIKVGGAWRAKPEWVEAYRALCAEQTAEDAAMAVLPSPGVYFIRSVTIGHIKIGTAADIRTRIGELQVGSADVLQLVGALEETGGIERGLHRRFDSDWVRGEWFRASPAVVGFVLETSVYRGDGYRRLSEDHPP